jgi:hypothetical protein
MELFRTTSTALFCASVKRSDQDIAIVDRSDATRALATSIPMQAHKQINMWNDESVIHDISQAIQLDVD